MNTRLDAMWAASKPSVPEDVAIAAVESEPHLGLGLDEAFHDFSVIKRLAQQDYNRELLHYRLRHRYDRHYTLCALCKQLKGE